MTENKKPTPNTVFKKVRASNLFNLNSHFNSLSRWIGSASLIPNFLKYVFVSGQFKKEQKNYIDYNRKLSIYNEYLIENGQPPYPLMSVVSSPEFHSKYSEYQMEQLTLLYGK